MTNFIFMVADDLGYADLGCYGGRSNCLPNLGGLAANGVRDVNGYANAPVYSPTRFALMTGRYQYRDGLGRPPLCALTCGMWLAERGPGASYSSPKTLTRALLPKRLAALRGAYGSLP